MLAFGVVFQFFAIRPMRDLAPGAALWAAVEADTLSPILVEMQGPHVTIGLVWISVMLLQLACSGGTGRCRPT